MPLILRAFDSIQVEDDAVHCPPVREIVAVPERANANVRLPPMDNVPEPLIMQAEVVITKLPDAVTLVDSVSGV